MLPTSRSSGSGRPRSQPPPRTACLHDRRRNDPDVVEQQACDGTALQAWELEPIGTKTFLSAPSVTHPGYQIVNAGTGLCLDDQNGVSSDGATVQEWTCTSTSTTMMWGSWLSADGNLLVANVRASNNRSALMTLKIASGSLSAGAPVELFQVGSTTPTEQEFTYQRTS